MKRLLAAALFPILLASCSSGPEVKRDADGNEITEPFVEVSGQADATDISRFLAGRPVRHGAALSRYQMGPDYQMYSKDILRKWKYRTSKRVAAQNAWSAANIRPAIGTPNTLLYPFGGPDLLYAMSMFPECDRYILLGLEPVGGLPALESADPGAINASLPRHAKSLESQLLWGYFITKDMKVDFSNGPLQGVTPVLLSALGLMQADITNVQSISAGGNSAVQIDYVLPGWGRKSMIYVSGDLSNGGFKGGYQSWLSSNASGSTAYFKAASYLMQDGGFSSAKNWVLSNCRSIVQDDSGIPYASLDQSKWDIRFFGKYESPIDFFAKHAQPDLKAAYNAGGPYTDLPFGSGYQMSAGNGNLLIAIRK